MKLEIYQENEEEQEEPVRVKLQAHNGTIELIICNKYGKVVGGGLILSITKSGIHRFSGVADFGFSLNPVNGKLRDV